MEFDKTKVMYGVYGPRQGASPGVRGRLQQRTRPHGGGCQACHVCHPGGARQDGPGATPNASSALVLRALEGAVIAETFPKTSVDVYATVREGEHHERI